MLSLLMMALLIILIITMYVRLSMLIRDDGIRIKVVQEQLEAAQKESMSMAQRYGLAGMRGGTNPYNMLLPSDRRKLPDDAVPMPLITNHRGNIDCTNLFVPKFKGQPAPAPVSDQNKQNVTKGSAKTPEETQNQQDMAVIAGEQQAQQTSLATATTPVASVATTENLEYAAEAGKNVIDYITEKAIELIEAGE